VYYSKTDEKGGLKLKDLQEKTLVWRCYERESEGGGRESGGRVVRDTTCNGGTEITFKTMKVPRHCPLVLLKKVRRSEVNGSRNSLMKINFLHSRKPFCTD
jgi:hypothetical protein